MITSISITRLLPFYFILLAHLFACNSIYGQKNAYPNGEIYKMKSGHKYVGRVFDINGEDISMVSIRKDTLRFKNYQVKRHYAQNAVDVYNNGKYNLRKGWKMHHEVGVFVDHIHSEFTFSKPLGSRVDLGIGLGHHYNSTTISSAVDWHMIDVHSIPFYAKGRYYINKGSVRLFIEGKFGYAMNVKTNSTPIANNGIVMDAGLGIYFSTSYRLRHSVSIKQYALTASGEAVNWSETSISNIKFTNLQFNRIVFSYSIEFGK